MNYQPRHAKRNKTMERIHTIIRVTIWSCIAITGLILADVFGRYLIEILP